MKNKNGKAVYKETLDLVIDKKKYKADLILREKIGDLSTDEKAELDHYLTLEHLLRLAKARAYQYISAS